MSVDFFDESLGYEEQANRRAWDSMAREAHPLACPVEDDELRHPLQVVDEVGWLGGNIHGWKVLCLAAGGGRHGALYAAAGANVTVVDQSPGMLELDRQVALQRHFNIRLFQASMTSMPMLRDGEFDLVIHPVSTCYLRDVERVFHEVARVLRPGGLYVSQHKQPMNLQASLEAPNGRYWIESVPSSIVPVAAATQPNRLREPGTMEFAHSLETLIGGIVRAGMLIEDLVEPRHGDPNQPVGSFAHRCALIPPYIRIKARRTASTVSAPRLLI